MNKHDLKFNEINFIIEGLRNLRFDEPSDKHEEDYNLNIKRIVGKLEIARLNA